MEDLLGWEWKGESVVGAEGAHRGRDSCADPSIVFRKTGEIP